MALLYQREMAGSTTENQPVTVIRSAQQVIDRVLLCLIHRSMSILREHLHTLPVHDLRAIAGRLGAGSRQTVAKIDLVNAIQTIWETEPCTLLDALSGQARSALYRLASHRRVPAALFWAEYGRVHHARVSKQPVDRAPWRQPQSVADELYYLGLLHSDDPQPLRRATSLCVPADLRAAVLGCLGNLEDVSPTAEAHIHDQETVQSLVHDTGQLLIYLLHQTSQGGEPVTFHHNRHLPASHAQRIRSLLWNPTRQVPLSPPELRSRLRLVQFLATQAGLIDAGHVTPQGHLWLAEPLAQQLSWLWHSWVSTSAQGRRAYKMEDADLPAPWPQPLIQQLAAAQSPFTPTQVAWKLLESVDIDPQFWVHHLPDIQSLEQMVGAVLMHQLVPMGVVTVHSEGESPSYAVTHTGSWLMGKRDSFTLWTKNDANAGVLEVEGDDWYIHLAAATSLDIQANVAVFGDHITKESPIGGLVHIYRLTPTTVANAVVGGMGITVLRQALERLQIKLAATQHAQLARWVGTVSAVRVTDQVLLQTDSAQQLAALVKDPQVRTLIHEVLSPTAAVLSTPADVAKRALRAAGYILPAAGARTSSDEDAGALWLAARIYRLLGAHLALPLPLSIDHESRLYQSVSAQQRGALEALAERLANDLHDLLDGRLAAPSPFLCDVEQVRASIQAALDNGQDLQLVYFAAGRNLLTRRQVTPYWLEENRGALYLRAYCHASGRVLLFRLDRIQSAHRPDDQGTIT